ncbi:MAG: L-aspartate oxidase [Bacteroidetes bacterium GWF2_33_16]|nr:MAG: L-aspartate oxidase [Bacteroidetes bacterium GWE2_32_14]OFY07690.1 MAG: L-aspartate oxidase [Bacteroidetes bacterium GWF2_33_16]
MIKETDFLVIGSGLAGLSFALKVADQGKVIIISKTSIDETNTRYAQGGIAAVMYDPDNFHKHIQDTLICGDGFCNREVVEMVVKEAPEQIQQLIDWGVRFDKNETGKYDMGREGGHSEYRVLHHKDNTGQEIENALVKRVREHKNIEIYEYHFAVEVITQHHLGKLVKRGYPDIECYGAYVLDLNTDQVHTFLSKVTLMATGGTGNIYDTTTNPQIATGDGIAMVYRAKGTIENLEFIQFHPTSFYNPGERPSFLITEALRGFGAILKTVDGKEFMQKYDTRGCLAPRDIVARAIDHELKIRGDDFVYLDATHLNSEKLKEHFPNIYEKCLKHGTDITKDPIPVVPAAHYMCGGIKVDMNGHSSIHNLYAAGEVSSTGLHGANRLASNSLLEAIVYADKAAKHALLKFTSIKINKSVPEWDAGGTSYPEEMVMITQNYKEMQQIMSNYVGIVRSNLRLERARKRLEIIFTETEELYKKSILSQKLCELRNLIKVGYLIIKMAQNLHESRGLHYTLDYPKKGSVSEF